MNREFRLRKNCRNSVYPEKSYQICNRIVHKERGDPAILSFLVWGTIYDNNLVSGVSLMTNTRRQLFILLLVLTFSLFTGPIPVSADPHPQIPVIEGWKIITEEVRDLTIPDKDLGWFIQQVLRSQNNRTVKVMLLTGSGPGELYIPEGNISQDDRPLGFGATYETFEMEGFRGIIEYYPYIGTALSLKLSPEATFILESQSLDSSELKELLSLYLKVMDLKELTEPEK
jgi:hypothetical protein